MSIAVVIPHVPVPERHVSLQRAIESVLGQTHQADEIHIAIDNGHEGPGATRTRALRAVQSEWTLYLDDDDWLEANCIQALLMHQETTGADVVYPWMKVSGGTDPFPDFEGQEWNNDEPHIFPITYLVRTDMAIKAGGFLCADKIAEQRAQDGGGLGEDWWAILALMEVGAKIVHLPERLWVWDHGGSLHFSGRTW